MSSQFVQNMLEQQRKRLTGALMGHLEREVYSSLTHAQQQALRKKVLTSISQYHDVCLDMLSASVEDGSVLNEEAMRMLGDIHGAVGRLKP